MLYELEAAGRIVPRGKAWRSGCSVCTELRGLQIASHPRSTEESTV